MRRGSDLDLRLRGTVLDSRDHRTLAEFYRRLLGARYAAGSEPGRAEEPRFIELEVAGRAGLVFQVDPTHQPPDWPDHMRAHSQAHVDVDAPPGRLDEAVEAAVALGARVLSTAERTDGMVVMADPAGHPFCLLDGSGGG